MFNNDEFLEKAKELATEGVNENEFPGELIPEDMYVVWFAKTLQNWKALVSTDVFNGVYVEVTYNGNKQEAYVDVYTKLSNVAYKDSDA